VLDGLHVAVVLGDDGLLLHGAIDGVVAAAGIDLSTVRADVEVSGDAGELLEADGTDTGVVAIHVHIRIGAAAVGLHGSLLDIAVVAESLGIEVDVLHVLRTEVVLYLHTVEGTVAPGRLGVKRIHAHRAVGVVVSRPYRAHEELGVFESIGLDARSPSLIHLTGAQ